ncbi:hypothetical protein CASFOL_013222 [Castilleja foliolosa]|uniref:F-box domain-containing protein n=1 Tax=Castilleja foliolosa TaxID=1961234 RepID=A0ABD3DMJ8_9LAMI
MSKTVPQNPINYPDFHRMNQNKPSKMANNVLPEELMLCIFTRLPVKTIVRFKSVCKPWFHLFSTPEFKKLHQAQFSGYPEDQSFIIHIFNHWSSEPKDQFYIFNIEYGKKKPTILDHPFAHAQKPCLETVGCCNGLVCIRRGQDVVLWNPATKMYKTVPLKDCGPNRFVSLGFGYDSRKADFKVVMVDTKLKSVEIYSVNLDSWITINFASQFSWFKSTNDFIVNGNPYWIGRFDEEEVLVYFDVLELVFKIVPVPTDYWMGLYEDTEDDSDGFDEETVMDDWNYWDRYEYEDTKTVTKTDIKYVDWNGALGALITNDEVEYQKGIASIKRSSRIECVWVWVFDDIEGTWRNDNSFAPIKVDVNRVLNCIQNEKILGTISFDKLCVLDLEAGIVKELFDGASLGYWFEVYGYTASFAHINGMENVVLKCERNKMIDGSS